MNADKNDEKTKGFTVQDRRWWLKDDASLANAEDQVEIKPPSYVEELQQRLLKKDETLREYIEAHKSSVADMDEVRQRLEKEQEKRVQLKLVRALEPFLEVLDNLTRLLQAGQQEELSEKAREGVMLILRGLEDKLTKSGIEKVETKNQKFDPKRMEALSTTEVPEEQVDMVLEEFQTGYSLGEHVVRPARVRVGVASRG